MADTAAKLESFGKSGDFTSAKNQLDQLRKHFENLLAFRAGRNTP